MTLPLAHAGDWLSSVITVVPVVLLIGWLVIITIRDRRRGVEDPDDVRDPGAPARAELGEPVPASEERQRIDRPPARIPPGR